MIQELCFILQTNSTFGRIGERFLIFFGIIRRRKKYKFYLCNAFERQAIVSSLIWSGF